MLVLEEISVGLLETFNEARALLDEQAVIARCPMVKRAPFSCVNYIVW